MALPNGEDPWFVGHLRTVIDQVVQTQPQQQNVTQAQPKGEEPVIPVVLAPVVTESGEHLAANFTPGATSTPVRGRVGETARIWKRIPSGRLKTGGRVEIPLEQQNQLIELTLKNVLTFEKSISDKIWQLGDQLRHRNSFKKAWGWAESRI